METLEVKRRVNRLAPVEVSADLLDVVGAITLPPTPRAPTARLPRLRRVLVGAGSLSAVVMALAYVVGAPSASVAEPVSPSVEEFAAEFADGSGLAPLSDPAVGVLDADRVAGGVVPERLAPDLPAPDRTAPPGGSVIAIAAPTQSEPTGDDPQAVHQLGRALAAPAEFGYVGALVIRSYARGREEVFRIDVQHVPGQGTRFDVLRSDGRVRAESFLAEPKASTEGSGDSLEALNASYDLALDGHQLVDGRETTVVSATEHGQLGARFWIDERTGVLLRRELYADGRLVRWSGFTSFALNRDGFMPHLPPEVPAPRTTPVSKDVAPALNDKGWACPEWLNDRFRLAFLNQVDADGGGVMRAEYTDGLSRIAIFEERGSLNTAYLHHFQTVSVGGNLVYVKAGLPMVAVWESDGTVFTAVTDAPQQVVSHLISRLPHAEQAPAPGVTSRIGDGLSRMVSAVSP